METWSHVHKCLNEARDHKKPDVSVKDLKVHLIGERNSGTKWIIVEEMKKCFPMASSSQRDLNGRSKH
jgi:hypothetical protein